MKKVSLVFIFIITILNHSNACMVASQNRIFPIGFIDNDLLIMHVDWGRGCSDNTEKEEGMPRKWCGSIYAVLMDKNYKIKKEVLIMKVKALDEEACTKLLESTFNKLTLHAIKNYKIELLTVINFDNVKCKSNFKGNDVRYSKNKIIAQTPFRKSIIDPYKEYKLFSRSYFDRENGWDYESEKIKEQTISDNLKINTLRTFKSKNSFITVMHICNGNSEDRQPEFIRPRFNNIQNSIYYEGVLHHGTGFDLLLFH